MARGWAVLLTTLGVGIAGAAMAQSGPPAPTTNTTTSVLCDDYKAVEQAALDNFSPMAGRSGKINPLIRLAPGLLAPTFAGARLVLPDANECDLRPSTLRPGKTAYVCFWKSQQPDWAAADQAKRIAACLGADLSKSDFSTDLTVVTGQKVRFTLVSQHTYDHYGVRLLVDGPQF
jgi:hypothetical protein